jgi:predicted nucleic acid-binding protein
MSIYADTSVLLKLIFAESESTRADEIAGAEPEIHLSPLTRLEALIVMQMRHVGGLLTAEERDDSILRLRELISAPPFVVRKPSDAIFQIAEDQICTGYCATLDRLHLAFMQQYGLHRLFTNDDLQAKAARALGFEVILPR